MTACASSEWPDLDQVVCDEADPLSSTIVFEEEVAAAWREPRQGPPPLSAWAVWRGRCARFVAGCLGVRLDAVEFRLFSQHLD